MSTTDVSGLHAKLDRKRNVEEENKSTQEAFRKRFRENIDAMKTQLTGASAGQISSITSVQASMGKQSVFWL